MLQSFFLSSILTLSLCYSWYSFYGVRFVLKSDFPREETATPKPAHAVPIYMWDIYKNGLDSPEVDVVRGIHPTFVGSSFISPLFRNHRRKQLEFNIPIAEQDETLMKAEVRVTANTRKNRTTHIQIYLKSDSKWIFLQEKKVSGDNVTWISLQVTPTDSIFRPGSVVSFLILTLFPTLEENSSDSDFSHPVLLLSYSANDQRAPRREKRNLGLEDYEEKTNRIWGQQIMSKNGCRRKSLYIEFSDIDYDSWIVAPSGYEAFQCVGKCTFPVGQHLSPTKHAILQTLLHSVSPWKASRACCVPTRLDPISILYLDENGILTYKLRYRDMVVAECGCR